MICDLIANCALFSAPLHNHKQQNHYNTNYNNQTKTKHTITKTPFYILVKLFLSDTAKIHSDLDVSGFFVIFRVDLDNGKCLGDELRMWVDCINIENRQIRLFSTWKTSINLVHFIGELYVFMGCWWGWGGLALLDYRGIRTLKFPWENLFEFPCERRNEEVSYLWDDQTCMINIVLTACG